MPTRRETLNYIKVGAGALVVGEIANKLGVIDRYLPQAPEIPSIKSDYITGEVLAIQKGVNIRNSPHIPNQTRFSHPKNTLDWDDIDEVNGKKLDGASTFIIKTPRSKEGSDTSREYKTGSWTELIIKKKGEDSTQAYYVSNSLATRDFVHLLSFDLFYGLEPNNEGTYSTYYGETVNASEIGKIYIPKNEKTLAREIMPIIWSKKALAKLDGKMQLRPEVTIKVLNPSPEDKPIVEPGEKIIQEVEIVASGSSEDARQLMENAGTPINIRNYPATDYYNNEPVELVGRLAQGARIKNVLVGMSDGSDFAVFKLKDATGLVEINRNSLQPVDPDTICAIHRSYISLP